MIPLVITPEEPRTEQVSIGSLYRQSPAGYSIGHTILLPAFNAIKKDLLGDSKDNSTLIAR